MPSASDPARAALEKLYILIDGTKAFTRAAAPQNASPAQAAFRVAVAHSAKSRPDLHYPATILVWSSRNDEWLTPGNRAVNPRRFDAMARVIDNSMDAISEFVSLSQVITQFADKMAAEPLSARRRVVIVTAPGKDNYIPAFTKKAVDRALEKLREACPQIAIDIVLARDTEATAFVKQKSRAEIIDLAELAARHPALTVYPCGSDPAEISGVVDMLLRERRDVPATPRP